MDDQPIDERIRLIALHGRVLAGDRSAREDLCRLILSLVTRRVLRAMPNVDSALIAEGVEDELLKYLSAPSTFDPTRSRLDRFIALGATHNVRDALRQIRRRLRHELTVGHDLPDIGVELEPAPSRRRQLKAVLRAGKTKPERALLHARLRGERRTGTLARILGVDQLSITDQRTEIHRTWVRLRARIRSGSARSATGRRTNR